MGAGGEGSSLLLIHEEQEKRIQGENNHVQREQEIRNRERIPFDRNSCCRIGYLDCVLHPVVLCSGTGTANFSVCRSGK
jgi:hypothetical protein